MSSPTNREVAEIADWERLAKELAEWSTDPDTLIGQAAAAIPALLAALAAAEARGRAVGHEDVLRFVQNGRFLHDDSPPAQFAKEVVAGWRAQHPLSAPAKQEGSDD